MATDLKGVQKATRYVLENVPESRNNDGLLVSKVLERINPIVKGLKFNFVLEHRNELNLPSFESITRTRRLLQSNHIELKADNVVSESRACLEEEFKAYSREKV